MRFEFHPEALDEYEEAARYYAACQEGLELRFISNVEHGLRGVREAPKRWRQFDGEVRRCLVRVFPFAILYTIESDYILILAIMHCSREPGYRHHRSGDSDRLR
jgi:plasmid stabilization system protein ParE